MAKEEKKAAFVTYLAQEWDRKSKIEAIKKGVEVYNLPLRDAYDIVSIYIAKNPKEEQYGAGGKQCIRA